jgi:mannose-1-phosphate guanylyltransferase
VAGVPFVAHQLGKLAAAGVERIVLATSYHAEQFEPTLGDGSAWGVQLVYVREEEPLGTGGAIRNVAGHLASGAAEPVVILNGDILSSHSLSAQLTHHRAVDADVTLHLVEVDDARPYGCVPTDGTGRVMAFLEKDPEPVSNQINAGCYVFARRVIDEIPSGRVVSVERETFPDLLARHRVVVGHVENCYWIDVGTPESLRRASCDLVRGVASSPVYRAEGAERALAASSSAAVSADIRGGSYLDERTVVQDGAVIEASVLMPGAVVGEGARVVRSVLGEGATIDPATHLEDAVVVRPTSAG